MRTKAGILVGSGDQSHKYGIPLPPTLSPSMLAGPEKKEGRSPCRKNNDSLPIKIPQCDTPFGQFKEFRSNVTIPLGDKSRNDLIVKINEKV